MKVLDLFFTKFKDSTLKDSLQEIDISNTKLKKEKLFEELEKSGYKIKLTDSS